MIYEGSSSILAQPLMTFPSDQLTSLEATIVDHYIVALIGTADGKIKKVLENVNDQKFDSVQYQRVRLRIE
jgi:hypothetical protein